MTSLIVDIDDESRVEAIVNLLVAKKVGDISIREDGFTFIPGLPYTRAERVAALRRAAEDYSVGRGLTLEKIAKKYPKW